MSDNKANSSWLDTKLKDTKFNEVSSEISDLTGKTLENFHVDRKMDIPSGEADIYLCSGIGERAGKSYVLKYYRRENAVKPDVVRKLMEIKSPCVAPVESFGIYENRQYTVLPYYKRPALSVFLERGVRFSEVELRIGIIPSVIEGLRVLHEAGVLHKDLKPANLIPDDTGEHVVLIDFDISSEAGGNTFATSCYAAPEAMQGDFYRETDYYALGITIYELFTGDAPSQNSGMSGEESERLSAVSKIEFPKDFPDKLKELVLGLTYKDISHRNEKDNPNRRWGYDEVERWLNGEKVPVPDPAPAFRPYTLDGKVYKTEKELITALFTDCQKGLGELGRGNLASFYESFDDHKRALCRMAEASITDARPHNLKVFSSLMYQLCPEITSVFCAGKEYPEICELGFDAVEEASRNGCVFEKFLTDLYDGGALKRYVRDIAKSEEAQGKLKRIDSLLGMTRYTPHEKTWILGYGLSENRKLVIQGITYENPGEFFQFMENMEKKDFPKYALYVEQCRKELEFFAVCIPEIETRERLQSICDDRNTAIFDRGEYHFKDGSAFRDFVKKLVSEKKVYELRRLYDRYGDAVLEISENFWHDESFKNLKKAYDDTVFLDEYLFRSEKDLKDYLQQLAEKYRDTPDFFKRFVSVHKNTLENLSGRPTIAKEIKTVLDLGNTDESYLNVYVNGTRYPTKIPMSVGKIYTYGSYPYEKDGTRKPIEWLVLACEDRRALLISKFALDCGCYDQSGDAINSFWKNCSLRQRLNDEFLKNAFSVEERKRVLLSHISDESHPTEEYVLQVCGAESAELIGSTEDQIFCLSISESEKYFRNDGERQCKPTPYALNRKIWIDDDGYCYWWLRSPFDPDNAMRVGADGKIGPSGYLLDDASYAVRPAFWINLKSVI